MIHVRSDGAVPHGLQIHMDNLAAKVRQRGTIHLGQLGVIRGQELDLSYRACDRTGSADGEETGTLRNIRGYYASLPSGRMVVLGDPGTGKTVLVIHLLLDLLQNRDDPVSAPQRVPVMLNASTWNIETTFSHWLAAQLRIGYGLPPRVARALVEGGHVLPLLDGLDEMDPPGDSSGGACAALGQLNVGPWSDEPVIVVCRSKEFQQLRKSQADAQEGSLRAADVIKLHPYSTGEARAYLVQRRDAAGLDSDGWAAVINALETRPSSPLVRALAMPWVLNLAARQLSAGGESAVRKIASTRNARKLENLLFADLIPSTVEADSAGEKVRGYTVEQTHHWLRGLALHLAAQRAEGQDGTTVALHELWRIAGPKRRASARSITVPALVTLAIFATVRPTLNLLGGIALGLALGVWEGGSVTLLLPGPRRLILRGSSRRTLWRRVGLGMAGGLSGFICAGLLAGIVVRFLLGFPNGVRAGLVTGVTAMFSYVPTVFLAGDRWSQPDEFRAIRDDWTAGFVIGLAAGASAGITAWLAFRLTAGITMGFSSGVRLGSLSAVGIAVGVGAGVGLSLAWTSVRYLRACRLLRRSGFFDGRPALFLDWARMAGLLRVAGGAYQFRYEAYPQWLVAHQHPVEL
jgi:hypothetical protein